MRGFSIGFITLLAWVDSTNFRKWEFHHVPTRVLWSRRALHCGRDAAHDGGIGARGALEVDMLGDHGSPRSVQVAMRWRGGGTASGCGARATGPAFCTCSGRAVPQLPTRRS